MEQYAHAAVLCYFHWLAHQAQHNNGSIVVFVFAFQKFNKHVLLIQMTNVSHL